MYCGAYSWFVFWLVFWFAFGSFLVRFWFIWVRPRERFLDPPPEPPPRLRSILYMTTYFSAKIFFLSDRLGNRAPRPNDQLYPCTNLKEGGGGLNRSLSFLVRFWFVLIRFGSFLPIFSFRIKIWGHCKKKELLLILSILNIYFSYTMPNLFTQKVKEILKNI